MLVVWAFIHSLYDVLVDKIRHIFNWSNILVVWVFRYKRYDVPVDNAGLPGYNDESVPTALYRTHYWMYSTLSGLR